MIQPLNAVDLTVRSRPDRSDRAFFADVTKVTAFFGAVTLVALIVLGVAVPASSVAALLWAFGMLAAGASFGFLFGHPRAARANGGSESVPGDPPKSNGAAASVAVPPSAPPSAEPRTRPSTALEEIVDWLTKMVVGIGLVQLKEVPGAVIRLGTLVSRSVELPAFEAQSIAVAIVVFFTSIGFLYGYLATRLYIQGAIDRADGALRQDMNRMKADLAEGKEKQAQQDTVLRKISKVAAASAVQASLAPATPAKASARSVSEPIITDAASTKVELWDTDPNKHAFGDSNAANGRVLEATLAPAFPDQPQLEACWVTLVVRSTDEERPLSGSVTFHLHPTYSPPVFTAPVKDGEASLSLQAWGAFTVGVEADEGATRLELDLAKVPGGPRAFYEN